MCCKVNVIVCIRKCLQERIGFGHFCVHEEGNYMYIYIYLYNFLCIFRKWMPMYKLLHTAIIRSIRALSPVFSSISFMRTASLYGLIEKGLVLCAEQV